MFGLCCVAMFSMLFGPSVFITSIRLFFPVYPYVLCWVFVHIHVHPLPECSPSFIFFFFSLERSSHFSPCLRVFLFSLSGWRVEGTAQVIGPLEAKLCDLTSSFISSFQPHGRVSGGLGGGSVRSNFLRTWGTPKFNLHEPSPEN